MRLDRKQPDLLLLPFPLVWMILIGMLLAGGLLSACSPPPEVPPNARWLYADLRAVEAPSALQPSFDLVAAYTRQANGDLQIRLDLLELDPLPSFDLYLALDTGPGGRSDLPFQADSDLVWDTLLFLPASGPTRAYRAGNPASPLVPDPHLIPRIVRYPWQDMLVVSLNAYHLSLSQAGFGVQAFVVAPPASGVVTDRIGPVRSNASTAGRAPLLLAFWNTFPAYTPAQALRRWDGAHTGPYGERHGLHLLLQAVQRSKVPVVLLDLKTPAALSALDYLGKLPQIQNLAAQGLLILPDALHGSPGYPYFPSGLPGWAWRQAAADSRQAGLDFGLSASQYLYTPVLPEETIPDYPFIFTQLSTFQVSTWRDHKMFPVPAPGADPRLDQGGLTLELRTELLQNAAVSAQEQGQVPLILLGGNLPDHPLGDPQAAGAVFNYIAAHPWIHPLSEMDLQTWQPAAPAGGLIGPAEAPYSSVLGRLPEPAAQSDPFSLAAWQAALALYAPLPPEPDELVQLRTLYSGQPGMLLAAADWAASPGTLQNCSLDADQDGQPECLLADSRTLALIDPLGGRLLMLFSRSATGLHQLVAPASQLIAGLTDPLEWNLEAGEAAETPDLQGAIADNRAPWQVYQYELLPGAIRLTSPDGRVRKTFQLTPNGMRIQFNNSSPAQIKIPIAIDPWQRFQPGWADNHRMEELPGGFAWQLGEGEQLVVSASTELHFSSFTDSRPQLTLAENPNFDYPVGHYLPFPLVVLEPVTQQELIVEFVVTEE